LPTGSKSLGGPEPIDEVIAKDIVRTRTVYGAYALSHRRGGAFGYVDAILDLKQGDKVIASIERGSTDSYQHRAYCFTPDGQNIISAGDSSVISVYDLRGQHLGDFEASRARVGLGNAGRSRLNRLPTT
jgi:hypothetical protein